MNNFRLVIRCLLFLKQGRLRTFASYCRYNSADCVIVTRRVDDFFESTGSRSRGLVEGKLFFKDV